MKNTASGIAIFLISYLIGGINPAYLRSKRMGFDIRNTGTGNAGASNAMLAFGKAVGIRIALADILKAYLTIRLAARLFPTLHLAEELAGSGCMLGHMLPVQLRFRGGKGLACLGGLILAFSPKCFLLILAAEAIPVLLTGYLAVIPMTAAPAFLILYLLQGGDPAGFCLYSGAAAVMEAKHVENLRRIRHGTEISTRWFRDREKETERIRNRMGEDSEGEPSSRRDPD